MYVQPTGSVHPSFGTWLDRRRKRIAAQMTAMDEERFEDLAELLRVEDIDRPPPPETGAEHREYYRMLAENEELVQRLSEMRVRILKELRDVERERYQAPTEKRRSRGSSIDGYV